VFPPSDAPRVFASPPGADFIGGLIVGLDARLEGQPPEALADVEVFVNTRRAARALEARLAAGRPRLLPRIRTVTDFGADPWLDPPELPAAVAPLRRRLALARLVRGLLRTTRVAPEAAAFPLAESLDALLDALGAEGLPPDAIRRLDASGHAEHWETTLRFAGIAADFVAAEGPVAGDRRRRAAVESLAQSWAQDPPQHPIIVAGSTGSRAPTRLLMALVARLPQGALILPGLDPDLPPQVWARLSGGDARAEDHPQHPFRALADAVGFDPAAVPGWSSATPPNPARNALLSLALRPAPFTDQWLAEAPAHAAELEKAIGSLTWIEAPSPRAEADAIALVLREAAETGTPAALITPDRTLARQVTARLERWGIVPDDSAGRPLALTPPGVLLRLLAGVPAERLPAETLLALLKHPLTASAPGARGPHLRLVQALEAGPLARHPPVVDWPTMEAWAAARRPEAAPWLAWIRSTLHAPLPARPARLDELVTLHRAAAERLASGPAAQAGHGLWDRAAGEAARALLAEIEAAADASDALGPDDYRALVDDLLFGRDVPEEAVLTHSGIAIWGALEARIQTARRVVLGGLNEGSWPQTPAADPWLSRPLRRSLGLPSPETRIGLSAHDFAQAAAAAEVVLSRAVRDDEAPTVPARWLLRIENLLGGIGEEGRAALAAAKARGLDWIALARTLDAPAPAPPARRPSPAPPAAARPRRLSVTQVETLVRDPYAIYARHVLGLRRLDPPGREADALARGTALHAVAEAFLAATEAGLPEDAEATLREVAERILAAEPWPAVRAIWLARMERIAAWFVATERERRARAAPYRREAAGALALAAPAFTLTARADRIDRAEDGGYAIYDYKSGGLPTDKQVRAFHLQLPLEAAMAEAGGFVGVPPGPVSHLELIGLGGGARRTIDPAGTEAVVGKLARLLSHYLEPEAGFTARLRPQRIVFESDYDHLSRRGEWADGDPPQPERAG
jgi:ATP-dependent helicase/nuclease subunit B